MGELTAVGYMEFDHCIRDRFNHHDVIMKVAGLAHWYCFDLDERSYFTSALVSTWMGEPSAVGSELDYCIEDSSNHCDFIGQGWSNRICVDCECSCIVITYF